MAGNRLRELDPERLLYEGAKPAPGRISPLLFTPVQLLDRLAAMVPPPRIHRHRYFRGAGANGSSREIFAATPNGRSWPFSDHRIGT